MKEKILIFTDLEGTLLREEDAEYDEKEMFDFLKQVSRLEKLDEATAEIHLVSPMFIPQISLVLNKLDKTFKEYNKQTGNDISYVESAMAFAGSDEDFNYRNIQDRVLMTRYLGSQYLYGTEKANYVENYIDAYKNRNAKRLIYMGNGKNDVLAMKRLKAHKGVVICPENSTPDVKAIADYTSDKSELSGLTDCVSKLCAEIEQNRFQVSKNDSKQQSQTRITHDEEER